MTDRCRVATVTILLLLGTLPAHAGGRLVPTGRRLVRSAPAPAPAVERVAPTLRVWAARARAGGETLRAIVLLDTGRVAGAQRPGRDRRDAVAAVEGEFLARTAVLGVREVRRLAQLPIVVVELPPERLEAVAADPAVRRLDPDLRMHALRAEGAALIRADELRTTYGGDGAGVGVAVVDSGIDATHPELDGGKVTFQKNYTSDPGDGTNDAAGHGTAVAGIIAGDDGGMAPAAHLWALKVLDSQGSGSLSDMLAALDDVLAHQHDYGGVQVVNMSLGGLFGPDGDQPATGPCDADIPTLASAIDALDAAGITVVAAAGNEGCKGGLGWPACISGAIAVGATYDAFIAPGVSFSDVTCSATDECSDSTTAAGMVTCYSNSGSELDLWAPSHCARTPASGGGYLSCFGGTSAAAPYVSGVVAQLAGLVPSATPSQIRAALTGTGTPTTDPANGITRPLVDAVAAYQQLQSGGGGGGGGTGTHFWVEWVIHASGKAGSFWMSDVAFRNTGSAPANLDFVIHLSDGSTVNASAADPVPAGGQAWFEDVLGQLSLTGKGSMEVISDQPGAVTARLYNSAASGTFGQFFAGHLDGSGLGAGESAVIPMLRQDSVYRTNLSVTNTGAGPASVTLGLHDASGSLVYSTSRTLAPGESYQWGEPFRNLAGLNSVVGSAEIHVTSGSGVVASGSVIDGRTNDPTTVPMVR